MKYHLSKLLVAIMAVVLFGYVNGNLVSARIDRIENSLNNRDGAIANFEGNSGDGAWLFPGEYESHQAMWMLWPTYENKAGFPSTEPMSDMIAHERTRHVNLAVQDADEELAVRTCDANGVPLDHVHFFQMSTAKLAATWGQFTRTVRGNFASTMELQHWGHEEPESDSSTFDEIRPHRRPTSTCPCSTAGGAVTGVR